MRNAGTWVFGGLLALLIAAGLFLGFGGTRQAVIQTDLGEIVVEFYKGGAPNHVKNFIKLAREGFYDGTTFHRVVPGFVLQGGDPLSRDDDPTNDGMGGPPWHVDQEFNDRHHARGIVSAAREGGNVNSAGSQFFICLADLPYLDGQYTVFAHVAEGMDVVDAITRRPRSAEDPERPRDPVPMRSVTIRTIYRLPLVGAFHF